MEKNSDNAENNKNLSANQIEEIIDRKILEAKLVVSEERLKLLVTIAGGMLVLFGIIIPIIFTYQSTTRVDRAVEKMELRFKELAATQLRKPDFDCFVNGKRLENQTLYIKNDEAIFNHVEIELRNIGDGIAISVSYRIYIKSKKNWTGHAAEIWPIKIKDEPEFSQVFQSDEYPLPISPQAAKMIKLPLIPHFLDNEKRVEAMIKIFYGDPKPKRIYFTFEKIT